jgi:hypothetical protein
MDDKEPNRVYAGKGRELYSGMVLDSIFSFLRRVIVVMVVVGISLMFLPYLR